MLKECSVQPAVCCVSAACVLVASLQCHSAHSMCRSCLASPFLCMPTTLCTGANCTKFGHVQATAICCLCICTSCMCVGRCHDAICFSVHLNNLHVHVCRNNLHAACLPKAAHKCHLTYSAYCITCISGALSLLYTHAGLYPLPKAVHRCPHVTDAA